MNLKADLNRKEAEHQDSENTGKDQLRRIRDELNAAISSAGIEVKAAVEAVKRDATLEAERAQSERRVIEVFSEILTLTLTLTLILTLTLTLMERPNSRL